MLYAAVHWSDMADPSVWPQAMEYMAYIYNLVSKARSGVIAIHIFRRKTIPRQCQYNLHI